jgi:hypothetical protein
LEIAGAMRQYGRGRVARSQATCDENRNEQGGVLQ